MGLSRVSVYSFAKLLGARVNGNSILEATEGLGIQNVHGMIVRRQEDRDEYLLTCEREQRREISEIE
jgi:hypothetical protein